MNRKCSIIPFLLILWLTSGCQSRGEYSDFYFDYFDTFTSFTAYAEDEQTFQNYSGLVQSVLGTYHKLLDPYHAYDGLTNLYTLNQSAGQGPIKVSKKLFSFLQFSLDAYEISRHSVNIALGPVTGLWREAIRSDSPSVPSRDALERAARYTDLSGLRLDPEQQTAELVSVGMVLDAGALAKGYAVSMAEEALRSAGCTSALLSAGGNILCIGSIPGLNGWNVGIQNPDTSSPNGLYTTWLVKDSCVVTSGDYERYFEVDGKRYHHIIDPATLEPSTRYHSVTVRCADAAAADLLSTALFILPEEEGRQLAREYNAEVLYIYPDYTSSLVS